MFLGDLFQSLTRDNSLPPWPVPNLGQHVLLVLLLLYKQFLHSHLFQFLFRSATCFLPGL